jgi:hypothetical protein
MLTEGYGRKLYSGRLMRRSKFWNRGLERSESNHGSIFTYAIQDECSSKAFSNHSKALSLSPREA